MKHQILNVRYPFREGTTIRKGDVYPAGTNFARSTSCVPVFAIDIGDHDEAILVNGNEELCDAIVNLLTTESLASTGIHKHPSGDDVRRAIDCIMQDCRGDMRTALWDMAHFMISENPGEWIRQHYPESR